MEGEGGKRARGAQGLALTAFETGLFGSMALMPLVLFPSPHLPADSAAFWFLMQVGMLVGYIITYPMNWWLIRHGIKEVMRPPGAGYRASSPGRPSGGVPSRLVMGRT